MHKLYEITRAKHAAPFVAEANQAAAAPKPALTTTTPAVTPATPGCAPANTTLEMVPLHDYEQAYDNQDQSELSVIF